MPYFIGFLTGLNVKYPLFAFIFAKIKPTVLRNFTKFLLSLVLCLSLITPAIVNIVNYDSDTVIISNLLEEENQNKTPTDLEEKKVVVYNFSNFGISLFSKRQLKNLFYMESDSNFTSKILLPPPEFFI